MSLNLTSLVPPISLRPSATLTDEELMRFSEENKPYRIERNKHGEIIIMTPVGGIGSTHEAYVANMLFNWNETAGTGLAFISNAGFNLLMAPVSRRMPHGLRSIAGTLSPATNRSATRPSAPISSLKSVHKATPAAQSKIRCFFGLKMVPS